jgi:site-specific DNA-methyltransferase (adenine-specific)
MILADLPYGTTACKWDTVIPFEPLWEQYKRLIKKRGAVVLFGSQPFTSALVMSNVEWFKYEWIWDKGRPSGCATAKRMPMKRHENISVFYNGQCPYYPIMTKKLKPQRGKNVTKPGRSQPALGGEYRTYTHSYPISIIYEMKPGPHSYVHPTQKPVALLEYLIRTCTNEGETVLDNVMGSGSTGVACVNTGRNFVGIEKEPEYFEIAKQRIEAAQREMVQAQMAL